MGAARGAGTGVEDVLERLASAGRREVMLSKASSVMMPFSRRDSSSCFGQGGVLVDGLGYYQTEGKGEMGWGRTVCPPIQRYFLTFLMRRRDRLVSMMR